MLEESALRGKLSFSHEIDGALLKTSHHYKKGPTRNMTDKIY